MSDANKAVVERITWRADGGAVELRARPEPLGAWVGAVGPGTPNRAWEEAAKAERASLVEAERGSRLGLRPAMQLPWHQVALLRLVGSFVA